MGLRERIFGDRFRAFAKKEIERIKDECGVVGNDRKMEKVGAMIVLRIREVYMQGGKTNYKYALALWQIGNAVYPEYVTQKDYPQIVENLWESPDANS